MSEYLAGPQDNGAGGAGPASRSGRHTSHVSHVDNSRPVDGEREHVRFGIPFNGVLPIWHDDATITWHRPADDTDLSTVLGMGLVESEPGPAQAPAGWQERVETGVLTDSGRLLLLKAATPSGRSAGRSGTARWSATTTGGPCSTTLPRRSGRGGPRSRGRPPSPLVVRG
mgnify:CR=1 FL=1